MEPEAVLNEAAQRLKEMTALIERASQLVREGAGVDELCEEARKLAEGWDARSEGKQETEAHSARR